MLSTFDSVGLKFFKIKILEVTSQKQNKLKKICACHIFISDSPNLGGCEKETWNKYIWLINKKEIVYWDLFSAY